MTTGTVITFYSYKGGVGRSFTMANIAVLLARWGYRVLAIDWDLEAPGLHHYFGPSLAEQPSGGVVDIAHDFRAGRTTARKYAVRVEVDGGAFSLLAAGRLTGGRLAGAAYAQQLQMIDWEELYEQGFAAFLETCRAEWTAEYDFVLIDSRTGVSDIAGICTAQLPDRLVVVFTANDQNLDDVVGIVERADKARDRLPYDRPRHAVLPVLSRFDNRVEYERAEEWRQRCADVVAPLFRNWLVKSVPTDLMMRHLTLPYVSYWSFGEQLPVLEERVPAADQISFALETVAAVIAQQFDRTDVLADNRDAYVATARSHSREFDLDLLVSSPRALLPITNQLIDELRALGVRTERSVSGDPELLATVEPAEHLCLVVDREVSRWQITEAEGFLRHTLGPDGANRQLFCVLTPQTNQTTLPGFLRSLRQIRLDWGVRPAHVARALNELITATPAAETEPSLATLRGAASALRSLPADVPYLARFALIEETVEGMTAALDNGDLDLLFDRAADLSLLARAQGNGARFPMPAGLRAQVDGLVDRIDRRINSLTDRKATT